MIKFIEVIKKWQALYIEEYEDYLVINMDKTRILFQMDLIQQYILKAINK